MKSDNEIEREARRVLPRLALPGAFLAPAPGGRFALFGRRNRWRKPLLHVDASLVAELQARGLIRPYPEDSGAPMGALVLGDLGESFLRRQGEGGFRAQHQVRGARAIDDGTTARKLTVNVAETPLGWLMTRKRADGKPLISAEEYEAGERLREDFERARLGARITTDWDFVPAVRGARRAGRDPAFLEDTALAARQRVRAALDAVGPGLGDILIDVCCRLTGLEDAERGLGWPRRSGKVVLKIALERLVQHYRRRGVLRFPAAGVTPADRQIG